MYDQIMKHIRDKKTYRIVFYGDSITSAEWVHPNFRDIFEYVLKEEVERKAKDHQSSYWTIRCINSGFSGADSNDLVNMLDEQVLLYKPDMVIVMATSNDIYSGISPETHVDNIKKIVDNLSDKVGQVVYSTDIASKNKDYDDKYRLYVEAVKAIFPYRDTIFINMFDEYRTFDLDKFFTYKSNGNDVVGINAGETDFIHPNVLGNAYIARVLLKEIFGVSLNPEQYMRELSSGEMFPSY